VVDKFEKVVKKLFAPIIAYKGWEDVVTEEMKIRIQMERMTNPSVEIATDYEAMIYLHTASLATPLPREMENIYSFLFSKYYTEHAKRIGVFTENINETEQRELAKLKKWIHDVQTK